MDTPSAPSRRRWYSEPLYVFLAATLLGTGISYLRCGEELRSDEQLYTDCFDLRARMQQRPDEAPTLDRWGNPVVLEEREGVLRAVSYGADGRPGGRHLDADLVSGPGGSDGEAPSFWEYLTERSFVQMHVSSGLFACAAAILTLLFARAGGERSPWVRGLVMVGLAVTGAVWLSVLHVPFLSGH